MEATFALAAGPGGIKTPVVWDATLKGFTIGRFTGEQEMTPLGVMVVIELAPLPVGLKGHVK